MNPDEVQWYSPKMHIYCKIEMVTKQRKNILNQCEYLDFRDKDALIALRAPNSHLILYSVHAFD